MKELKNELKKDALQPCYLFFGEENYLKKYYEEQLLDHCVLPENRLMNVDIFEDKAAVEKIYDAFLTQSFLSEKRVVVVRNSKLFVSGRKNDSDWLAEKLTEIPSSTVLIFIEDAIDKRGKLFKTLAKTGRAVEFKTPYEKELITWVSRELKKENLTIAPDTAQYFLRYTGHDMNLLSREIAKIAAYKNHQGEISPQDIDAVVTQALETKIFDLVDAVGHQSIEKTLQVYNNLLLYKESPVMVLSMAARQFRLILQCMSLSRQGLSANDIAGRLSIRSFVASECLRQSRHFSEDVLMQALSDCLDTDIKIKTGKMPAELAVETLLLKYTSKRAS